MKDSRLEDFFLLLAVIIKFSITVVLINPFISLLYSIFIGLFSLCLYKYKMEIYNYIMLLMIDFLLGFIICQTIIGVNFISLTFSIIYFSLSGVFLYYLLFEDLIDKTSFKTVRSLSNYEVDKGLKALEKDNYKEALECFTKAIKENKKNYLGYMGMCNTLHKIDKSNIKKIKYYKKKCIKYAPKGLKDSINDKY